MHTRSNWKFGAWMLIIFTLILVRISGNSSQFTNYEVFVGRTFSSGVEFTTVARSKAACLVSLRALTNDDVYTIAVYNESSKSCIKPAIGNQSVIIQESGNTNIMAIWSTSVCSAFTSPKSAVYEYIDTDLYGFDMTAQGVSSVTECVHLCVTNHGNEFKGFVYRYEMAGSFKTCYCKSVSREEFQNRGYSLGSRSGYSYYARVCFY